jgi:hypothetical protein
MVEPSLIELAMRYNEGEGARTREMYGLYEGHLSCLRNKPLKILELGVLNGRSLFV